MSQSTDDIFEGVAGEGALRRFQASLDSSNNSVATPFDVDKALEAFQAFESPLNDKTNRNAKGSTTTDATIGLDPSWAKRIDDLLSTGSVAIPQGIHETIFNARGTTIPVLGERNSDACHTNGVPGFPGEHEENEVAEEDMTQRKRQESDFMLAQVYHELARASQDMANWSRATAVALEEKLAAEQREFIAAEKLLDAQQRYEQATVQITQAYEHRSKR